MQMNSYDTHKILAGHDTSPNRNRDTDGTPDAPRLHGQTEVRMLRGYVDIRNM